MFIYNLKKYLIKTSMSFSDAMQYTAPERGGLEREPTHY